MKKYSTYILFIFISLATLSSCRKEGGDIYQSGDTGTGGSLARFTIAGDYLYTVDKTNLKTYLLTENGGIQLKSTLAVGWAIETIYPYDGKLFIGSREAMYIYDLTNPTKPKQLSIARHVRACDPVVAQGNVAYVTVRSGVSCGGQINALLIYDVKDLKNPVEKKSIPLSNPNGLGVHKETLYVCDGPSGLKIFDIKDPFNPKKTDTLDGYSFIDCIPFGDILICMVENGLVLYDITDPQAPKFLVHNPKQA